MSINYSNCLFTTWLMSICDSKCKPIAINLNSLQYMSIIYCKCPLKEMSIIKCLFNDIKCLLMTLNVYRLN